MRDAEWLASDRVGMGYTDTLRDATAHVSAYLAGVADARQGTVVVDPDAVLPDLIAALETLRDTVAPRA
jgi:hypothetical protein